MAKIIRTEGLAQTKKKDTVERFARPQSLRGAKERRRVWTEKRAGTRSDAGPHLIVTKKQGAKQRASRCFVFEPGRAGYTRARLTKRHGGRTNQWNYVARETTLENASGARATRRRVLFCQRGS
ncbi:hypothetical protein MTO96_024271 [Rhipicephalus appendiculatus]